MSVEEGGVRIRCVYSTNKSHMLRHSATHPHAPHTSTVTSVNLTNRPTQTKISPIRLDSRVNQQFVNIDCLSCLVSSDVTHAKVSHLPCFDDVMSEPTLQSKIALFFLLFDRINRLEMILSSHEARKMIT